MITDIIGISGSRVDYPIAPIYRYIRTLQPRKRSILIVQGGAAGVDHNAKRYAQSLGFAVATIPYFHEYGNRGGYIRNEVLVDFVHRLVAFWDLESRGTKHAIDIAKAQGKLELVYGPKGEAVNVKD